MKKRLASLNSIKKLNEVFSFPDIPKSVLLIDSLEIDNFVNHKLLEIYGVKDVIAFRSPSKALAYLKETDITYQLILVDIYLPIMNGFEFIDKFYELNLDKQHGEICLLSASLDPLHKQKSKEMNIKFIEKPLTIDKLLSIKQLIIYE